MMQATRPTAPALRILAALVALALPLLARPTPAAAQGVVGQVVDADHGRPIPNARVLLLEADGAAVDSTTTGDDGRFRVDAPAPDHYLVHVEVEAYLSYSDEVHIQGEEVVEHRVEMPVISVAAARVMKEVIDREAAFQIPLDELCQEPLRPWEAGVLVGVAREQRTLDPIPRAVVRLEPIPDSTMTPDTTPAPRTRAATLTGAYWFCNVLAGRARLVVQAHGFSPDTSSVVIRAGTMSWYDALLR